MGECVGGALNAVCWASGLFFVLSSGQIIRQSLYPSKKPASGGLSLTAQFGITALFH
jgi:hypothetical protein